MFCWKRIAAASTNCHTKEAWEALLRDAPSDAPVPTSRPIQLIFHRLRDDGCGLRYSPSIWATLLNASIVAWDLRLGREIAEHCSNIVSPLTMIPAAKIFMDSQQTEKAKSLAKRALRSARLDRLEHRFFKAIIASAAAIAPDPVKAAAALREALDGYAPDDHDSTLSSDFEFELGRTSFLLGESLAAGRYFERAAASYGLHNNPARMVSALFNAAANFDNEAMADQGAEATLLARRADELARSCLAAAQSHGFSGPESACHGFLAARAGNDGRTADAIAHLKDALQTSPESDGTLRHIHLHSLLIDAYFDRGEYRNANKAWTHLLKLTRDVDKTAFHFRMLKLEAKVVWESGSPEKSHETARAACRAIAGRLPDTIEAHAFVARYLWQCALLGEFPEAAIQQHLANTKGRWENVSHFPLALLALGKSSLERSSDLQLQQLRDEPPQPSPKQALELHIVAFLDDLRASRTGKGSTSAISASCAAMSLAAQNFGPSPLDAFVLFAKAATAHMRGDLDACRRYVARALTNERTGFAERTAATQWLGGASSHPALVAVQTRLFFRPTVSFVGDGRFSVNGVFNVDLSRHQTMLHIFRFLMRRPEAAISLEDLHTRIWQARPTNRAWKDKVYGALARLRSLFASTMAPIVLVDEGAARLNVAAIDFLTGAPQEGTVDQRLFALLERAPASSKVLSAKLGVPLSTTKRRLTIIAKGGSIHGTRSGREVLYHIGPGPVMGGRTPAQL